MARLAVLEHPDPRLRTVAQPVDSFGTDLQTLVDDLLETLYASDALGLSATQVDVHRQVIVIDISGNASAPQVFINPQILTRGGTAMVEEGCLSVPGVSESVKRSLNVRVSSLDRNGVSGTRDIEGLLSVCLQHEMDHLVGKLFIDRLSPMRKLRLRLKSG
jgi:peptide deformylase